MDIPIKTDMRCNSSNPHDVIDTCLLNDLPDAIFLIDAESSKILYANRSACESVGMTRDEILFQSVLSLQADVINLSQWAEIATVIKQSKTPYLFLGRHKRKDGSVFPVEVRSSNIQKEGKHLFLSVARDITCRHVIDEELEGHKHSLWYALNEATDGIWEWNVQSGDLYVSPKLKQMRGYGPHEIVKSVEFWADGIHKDDKDRVKALMDEHLKGKLDRYEAIYRLRNRAGHFIWVHDRGKISEVDSEGAPLVAVGMVQNVTEQVKLQERLENQAARDELTGVFNRRVCKEVLEQLIISSRINGSAFSVFLLDLDHFKNVNDEFGHSAGDKALKGFVSVVESHLRDIDILFRWGGEEFLVLLPTLDAENARVVADKLRKNIEKIPIEMPDGSMVHLTASIGVAVYPEHSADRERLIQRADIAMYRAKSNGRNRVEIFTE